MTEERKPDTASSYFYFLRSEKVCHQNLNGRLWNIMAPVYKDKDFLQKLDRCIEDTQHAKSLYEFYKKAYEAEERAKSIPEEETEEEKFLLAKI